MNNKLKVDVKFGRIRWEKAKNSMEQFGNNNVPSSSPPFTLPPHDVNKLAIRFFCVAYLRSFIQVVWPLCNSPTEEEAEDEEEEEKQREKEKLEKKKKKKGKK